MDNFQHLLGKKIKQIRKKHKLKQNEFSEKINIEAPTLSNIENGKSCPSVSTLNNIINAFNVTPNDLFDVQHLLDEKTLDYEIMKMYKTFSLDKKQYFYRLIKFLFEINP